MAAATQSFIVYSLEGDEEEAKRFAAAEFERIADELDKDDSSSSQQDQQQGQGQQGQGQQQEQKKFEKAFTAYLRPAGPTANLPQMTRPSDYVPVHFPWDDAKALAAAASSELEGLYVADGEARVEQFLGDLPMTIERHAFSLGKDPSFPNAVEFTDAAEAEKAGEAVSEALNKARLALYARASGVVTTVGQSAVQDAKARLKEARDEILSEAPRYLDLSRTYRADGEEIVTTTQRSQIMLRGPALPDFVKALRDVHARRRALEAAAADFAQKQADVREGRRAQIAQFGGPRVAPSAFADISPEEMAALYPHAVEDLEIVATDLALALTVYSADFPLLARAWRDLEPPAAAEILTSPGREPTLVAHTAAGSAAVAHFKDTIWNTLHGAWEANRSLEAKLEPDYVWRFPLVTVPAIDRMGYSNPSFEFRAVTKRLEDEKGMSLPAKLAVVNGALAFGAELLIAAPGLNVGLAVVGAALDLLTTVVDYQKWLYEEEAFKATLDPSKALASEPEYEGLVIDLAFSFFGLKGVKSAMKSARMAREAQAAAAALEAGM